MFHANPALPSAASPTRSLPPPAYELVGKSAAIAQVREALETVARTDATVLVQGETGTGKELAARAVHRLSDRAAGPFVALNCAALPPSLAESELFGHERGAFTDAREQRKGHFELADRGTLFLDEIGDLPLALQAKLLRVLQDGQLLRVGATHPREVDVRIVAATNRDLSAEVASGRFRADLYYRLFVFPVVMPALRHRAGDIPDLVEHFVEKYCARTGRTASLPHSVQRKFLVHSWPGNVRELENAVERALIWAQHDSPRRAPTPHASPKPMTMQRRETLREVEHRYIVEILDETGWVIEGPQGAARVLGLKPSTLRSRMHKHGIVRPERGQGRTPAAPTAPPVEAAAHYGQASA